MSTKEHVNGRSHKKRKVKQKHVLEQVPQPIKSAAAAEDGNSKFARALGSTDYSTREKGLQALSRWLVHKNSMSELDMMKLWKGLFFCFWHSDKVPVQVRPLHLLRLKPFQCKLKSCKVSQLHLQQQLLFLRVTVRAHAAVGFSGCTYLHLRTPPLVLLTIATVMTPSATD